ncbi:uncharacterized protein LOC107769689 [Nicotiana tabacum]|uniref:E3 ubiquitin-protein ligase BRE1-like n=2 Tax=Nicotiana TaxID=4085 RepID=A0A1S3XWU6_TOBAC|nr:PREDICTED: E3 ubiquitin-protein ligase BRE1-like [Nicotiana sylvestris]XP_016444411.1 PREDICTED: E3 ubiquitin-protein ligase BRE1-like [Nicotiana tabacum]
MESAAGGSGNSSSLRTLMFNDKIDTPNLGDFLRVKENNNNTTAGLTLGAVLSNKPECSSSSSPVHSSNRTLLDIIQEDPNSSRKTRKTWKHFRNKLRLKRAADTWTSNISIQQGNNNPIVMSRRLSPRSPPPLDDVTYQEDLPVENFGQREISASGSQRILRRISSRNETAEEEESEGENAGGDEPVRMSLMALLAENDGDGSAYMIGDGDEEEDEEEEEVDDNGVPGAGVGAGAVGEYNNCCVCMVRHKGAAFIPCGHTFCRLCCRELWVQRGNCPLCNNLILEVLDIF